MSIDFSGSGPRVSLQANLNVGESGSSNAFQGFSGLPSVFVSYSADLKDASRGSPSLTMVVEQSTDGNIWTTAHSFTTIHDDGHESATITDPDDYLRVSWTLSGNSQWYIREVYAAPVAVNENGGSLPLTGGDLTGRLSIEPTSDMGSSLQVSSPSGTAYAWFVINTNGASSASFGIAADGSLLYQDDNANQTLQATHDNKLGFFDHNPVARPTVTGAKLASDAALASLLSALASLGLIVDSTT